MDPITVRLEVNGNFFDAIKCYLEDDIITVADLKKDIASNLEDNMRFDGYRLTGLQMVTGPLADSDKVSNRR